MHESDSREMQHSLGWSTFQDHPHIWGTDELKQKLSDGVFAPEAISS
jgi:hypothetical protein